jgi:carbon storage regulator
VLVLTRQIGEVIVIGDDIRVTVLSINGQRIRLGITAPPTSKVFRGELPAARQQQEQGGSPGSQRSEAIPFG